MKTKKSLILTSLFLTAFLFINFVTNQSKTNNEVAQNMGKICSYIEENKNTNLSIDTTFTVSNYKLQTFIEQTFFKTSQPNDTLLLLIHSDMRPISE